MNHRLEQPQPASPQWTPPEAPENRRCCHQARGRLKTGRMRGFGGPTKLGGNGLGVRPGWGRPDRGFGGLQRHRSGLGVVLTAGLAGRLAASAASNAVTSTCRDASSSLNRVPNLVQGIPWKRKRCEGLRDRVLSIGLQRQHPLGDTKMFTFIRFFIAIAQSETTTSHQGPHPETGLGLNGSVRGAGDCPRMGLTETRIVTGILSRGFRWCSRR